MTLFLRMTLTITITIVGSTLAFTQQATAAEVIAQGEPLRFELVFAKTAFTVDEPVTCNMLLTNISTEPLLVNKRFLVNLPFPSPHEVYFLITDESGRQLHFQLLIRAGNPEPGDFTTLAPGDSVGTQILYRVVDPPGYDLSSAFDLARPGSYTVMAVYENRTVPEATKAWTGRLESDATTITIAE